MPLPISDLSPDTLALTSRLVATPVGEVCPWPDLDAAIGRKVRSKHRYLVMSALRVALRDHGALFASVRGEGYRRLPAERAHEVGARARTQIGRKARRAGKSMRQAIARANDVPAGDLRKINREVSVLGLIAHISTDRAQVAVEPEDTRATPVALVARQFLTAIQGEVPEA